MDIKKLFSGVAVIIDDKINEPSVNHSDRANEIELLRVNY